MKKFLMAFGFAALLSLPAVASAGGQSSSGSGNGSFGSNSMRQNPNGTATPIRVAGGFAQPRTTPANGTAGKGAVVTNYMALKPGVELRTVATKGGQTYQRAYQKTLNKNGRTVLKEIKSKDAWVQGHVSGPFQPESRPSTGLDHKVNVQGFSPTSKSFTFWTGGSTFHTLSLDAKTNEYREYSGGAINPNSKAPTNEAGVRATYNAKTGVLNVHVGQMTHTFTPDAKTGQFVEHTEGGVVGPIPGHQDGPTPPGGHHLLA